AWGPRRHSGCPAPRPAPPPRSRRRLLAGTIACRRRRRAAGRVDDPVERFARPDHAQLAARALLDRGLAGRGLEVGDLGRQRRVALAQALVLARLLLPLVLRLRHFARPAGAEPQPVLQPAQQQHQNHQHDPQDAHRGPAPYRGSDTNASRPAYRAPPPSASSMRSSWLYLATRSLRHSEPVLIWVAVVATAMSEIVVSSVSPERCETTAAYLALSAKIGRAS